MVEQHSVDNEVCLRTSLRTSRQESGRPSAWRFQGIEHALKIAWRAAVLCRVRDAGASCSVRFGELTLGTLTGLLSARGGGGEQPNSCYTCRGGEDCRDLPTHGDSFSVHYCPPFPYRNPWSQHAANNNQTPAAKKADSDTKSGERSDPPTRWWTRANSARRVVGRRRSRVGGRVGGRGSRGDQPAWAAVRWSGGFSGGGLGVRRRRLALRHNRVRVGSR